MGPLRRTASLLQEFSIPLIGGVLAALLAANLAPDFYHHASEWRPFPSWRIFGHPVTLHFFFNDIFMVFFFGIAAKEITEAALPGGDLNPIQKAISPLIATAGGIFGPVLVFFASLWLAFATGIYGPADTAAGVAKGWGIPTATDIALAWLVARAVFGRGHPAVNFLLLLAVADDAVGLIIIAIFYGDPAHPAQPQWLALVALAIGVAFALRKMHVRQWPIYIFGAGPIAWCGLMMAHLHPALALVFVVPFLPGTMPGKHHLFDDTREGRAQGAHAPLHMFEHQLKAPVDFGLFFFAFTNAGVAFSGLGTMTWLVLGSLVVGKTLGVWAMGMLAAKLGFPLPDRMQQKDLAMAGFIAAIGLTVALFVSSAAFAEPGLQGEAKMGALLSGLVALVAIALGRVFGFGRSSRRSAS